MTAFSEQSTVPSKTVLLGDIGATNARFALLKDGVIGPVTWSQVAHHRNFGDALETLLKVQYRKIAVSDAILAVAGPVNGGRFYFTNSSWTIDDEELRDRFDFNSVRVLNDFEATALSLPHLTEQDLCALGGGHAAPGKPAAVLGPGTGLGVRLPDRGRAASHRNCERGRPCDLCSHLTPRRRHYGISARAV